MVLTCGASWVSPKGKYAIALEDDMEETDAEGQVDVLMNRLDIYKDKGVRWVAVLDKRVADCQDAKDNRVATKLAKWIVEQKVPHVVVACPIPKLMEVAASIRAVMMLDQESREAWFAGRGNIKSLSLRTWGDIHTEAKEFLDKASKDKKQAELVGQLKEIFETKSNPAYAYMTQEKGRAERVMNTFRRVREASTRVELGNFLIVLENLIGTVCTTEAILGQLKGNDRVMYIAALSAGANALSDVLAEHYQLDIVNMYPGPEEPSPADGISERELGQVLDSFLPRARKNKKKKKKPAKKDGSAAAGGEEEDEAEDEGAAAADKQ